MLELERDWSYADLVEWHAVTGAIEVATERARREAEREAEAARRAM